MVRRSGLCLVAILLIAVSALDGHAQVSFGAGLRTGFNFGTISTKFDIPGKSGRTTFIVGGAFEVLFAKIFAPEIGILYVGKGMSFPQGNQFLGQQGGATITTKISELDFPILFKVKFMPGSRIRPYAFLGPNLGIVLSAVQEYEGAQGFNQFQQAGGQEVDVKNNISGMDFSLEFGGGAEFLIMPSLGVFLDTRYSLGLTNLLSLQQVQGQAVQQDTQSWSAMGFQVQLGGMFHF